jgi:type I restriction enzyme S subunit
MLADAGGSTIKHIYITKLAQMEVPVPPREERTRISDILDTIDEAIAHTSSLIAKLKQMKAGLLHDLLTRGLDENGELRDAIGHPEQFKDSPLGQIPKDWEVLPLQNFTLSSAFGPRFSGNAYDADGNVATLRTTDMDDEGNLNLSTMPLARLNLDLYRSHFLEIGDLLVSRSGTCGITAVFPGFDISVLPGAFVIRFRFKNGLLSEFVRRYFNWETGRERVLREAEGGVQKNLRGSTLLKLLIPVPVEAEQREILRRLDAHESRIRTEEAYREKLKLQKQGLMHDLLTGKVRVKI